MFDEPENAKTGLTYKRVTKSDLELNETGFLPKLKKNVHLHFDSSNDIKVLQN